MDVFFKDWKSASAFSKLAARISGKSTPVSRDGDSTYVRLPDGFRLAVGTSGVAAALTIAALLQGHPSSGGLTPVEYATVLDAMRRSTNALTGASEGQIAEYVSNLSPEQMQGFANNVKGIYHEMLFVADYNAANSGEAFLHDASNHPGSDVYVEENGEVVAEFQLKATDNVAHIQAHTETYPDVTILVTDEVASVTGAATSGFSNEELGNDVNEAIEALGGTDVFSAVASAASTAVDFVGEHGAEIGLAVGKYIVTKTIFGFFGE